MIGKFTIPGTEAVCVLDDELQWQAPGRLQGMLQETFDPLDPEYSSPAKGMPGYLAVTDAALSFGAIAEFETPPPVDFSDGEIN